MSAHPLADQIRNSTNSIEWKYGNLLTICEQLEQKLTRLQRDLLNPDKADKHELHSTNSNVDSLERANRELRTEVNGLRSELQTLTEEVSRIKEHLGLAL